MKILAYIVGGVVALAAIAGFGAWFFLLRAPSPEDQCAHIQKLATAEAGSADAARRKG